MPRRQSYKVLKEQLTNIKEQANVKITKKHRLVFNAIIQRNEQSGGEETP
jgi:hypothetical protein